MKQTLKTWLMKPAAKALTMLVLAVGIFTLTASIAEAAAGSCPGCVCPDDYWVGTGGSCKPGSPGGPCAMGCGGHQWTETRTKSATCTESGYVDQYCSVHKDWHRIRDIDPLDHDWGSWSDHSDSQHRKRCHRCGTKDYEGHYYGDWDTNDNDGYHRRYCRACNPIRRPSLTPTP